MRRTAVHSPCWSLIGPNLQRLLIARSPCKRFSRANEFRRLSFLAVAMSLAAPVAVDAQTAAPSSDSQTQIRMLVGSGPGGGYDTYGRLIAAHLPRKLPGQPRIVVQNMPGAGSLVVTNYLVNIAPRNGSVIAAVHSLAATHPLFYPDRAKYDARRLVWIGSAVRETTFALAAANSGVTSLKDLFKRDMIVAGSTGSTTSFPTFLNSVLKTRFNVVKGYNATSAALLALERGEVDGLIGITGPGLKSGGQRLIDSGKARVFVQFGMSRHRDFKDVDWVFDYAASADQRLMMNLMFGTQEFGRPFVAPPGVSDAVATTLRAAFADVLKDEALLAEASKRQLDVEYTSPAEIEEIISRMYEAPESAIELVRQLLGDQAQ